MLDVQEEGQPLGFLKPGTEESATKTEEVTGKNLPPELLELLVKVPQEEELVRKRLT